MNMKYSIAALKRYDQAEAELHKCVNDTINIQYLLKRLGVKYNKKIASRLIDNDTLSELIGCFDIPKIHLQEAFWKDTKHINSRYNCKFVGANFVKEMVLKHENIKR